MTMFVECGEAADADRPGVWDGVAWRSGAASDQWVAHHNDDRDESNYRKSHQQAY